MLNKLILLFITFIVGCSSHAQTNVSFDSECLEKNSAILAQSLIESVGTDTVMELLENGTRFLLFCEVDSLGGILKFNKLISKKEVSKDITDKFKTYLINNDEHFFICCEKPQGLSDFDAYKLK